MRQIGLEARAVFRAARGVVDPRHGLPDAIERVMRQIALGAAGFLAQRAHRFQLVQQVAGRLVDVQHPADHAVAPRLRGQGDGRDLRAPREIIGVGQGIDARPQGRLVRDALDLAAVHMTRGR